ncbi:DUF5751 family protein [Sulfurisphaera tokodaii]|uniref:DUF5751 domain-containing protein n=2 Tax=Sulfurisphaera tokodaii TaxID=111955 RepID=Q975B5_SULTO|nr:DUF5751 family protein [Sulfurisphaera tokodaii]BAB65486.1 hypothetical protein STK_04930 [Sulfurisphaera tokodaii str. 7]HII74814.1 hypothetical protein [Sulfurisphaera tokodaii]
MPYKNILTLISVNNDNFENYFRKIFLDVRSSGSKKTTINVFTEIQYQELVTLIREALLENIDIGYELFLWKKNEVDIFLKNLEKSEVDGLLVYCDDENKVFMSKIVDNLPTAIKRNLIKDFCRKLS